MIRTRRTKNNNTITGINITPFTDVCLVMLIIFIVTAHAFTKESSLRLNLPRAASAQTPLPASLTLQITRERRVYLDTTPVTFETLGQRLKQARGSGRADLLVVKADEGVPYRLVITAIDIARTVGFDQIALATRQPETTAARR
jgi:biopolymer transport protein ExbD